MAESSGGAYPLGDGHYGPDDFGGSDYENDPCPDCIAGERNACIDDLCAGERECMHGDGMVPCGTCGGSGWV